VPLSDYNFDRPDDVSIENGYRVVYNLTDTGYTFIFNISWKKLLNGFTPTVGKRIGFDVLASDNDRVANELFRNQITWNCPTDKPYNDPSLFGTLELADGGVFKIVKDTTVPSVPTNLAAKVDKNMVFLTWDPSTDNIAVLKYIIYKGDDSLTTVYGAKTDNKNVIVNLANGNYTFKVRAVDNSGNRSAISSSIGASVDYTPSGIDDAAINEFINYPNPVDNSLNIDNASNITMVEILGMNGKVISAVSNKAAGLTLNTSDLASGVYLLRLTSTDGQVAINKIVKE
jgi:hypothetical protein